MKNIITIIFLVIIIPLNNMAANVSTLKAGNWNDPSVWSSGTVPSNGATITISHRLTVNGNYNYSSSNVSVGWSGALIISSAYGLTTKDLTISNGGGATNLIDGNLTVTGKLTKSNGFMQIGTHSLLTVSGTISNSNSNIEVYGNIHALGTFDNSENLIIHENAKILVDATFSNSGGSTTNIQIDGTLEVNTLSNNGDAIITVGPVGQLIIHNDYNNGSGAQITINGGSVLIEGNYNNTGDGLVTINDGGSFTLINDLKNTGGSSIVLNDGTATIGGDVSNNGGSNFEIAPGSSITVSGDLTNNGGGSIVVDGSLSVDGTLKNSGGGSITGTGTVTAGTIDDPQNKIEPGLLVAKTLFAITSTAWSSPTTWSTTNGGATCNCIPTSESLVTIPSSINVNLNTAATISTLTIVDGANLTINASGSLILNSTFTLNGSLNLQNSATSSASIIDNGATNYGANASVSVSLYNSGNAYHYISSSVPNIQTTAIHYIDGYLNNNVYQYDETAADNWGTPNDDNGVNDFIGWVSPSANLNAAQGYIVYVPYDYTFTLSSNQLNTGNYNANITNTNHPALADNSTYDGWNLLGNPYPSGIDATKFLTDNMGTTDGNLYLWDDDNSAGTGYSSSDYIQINSIGTITNSQSASSFNGIIAPNQAFIVKSTVASGLVSFTNAQRSSTNSYLLKSQQKAEGNEDIQKIKLSLSNTENSLYNETLIAFTDSATNGFDIGMDGLKRKGNPNIAFYSLLDNMDLGIQTLGMPVNDKKIGLAYETKVSGNYTISLKESTISEENELELTDLYNGKITNLKAVAYSFTSEAGIFKNRFVLKTASTLETTINQPANSMNELNIAVENRAIKISNLTNRNIVNGKLTVYNLEGKALFYQNFQLLNGGISTLNLPDLKGFFIARVSDENGNLKTQKIILQ